MAVPLENCIDWAEMYPHVTFTQDLEFSSENDGINEIILSILAFQISVHLYSTLFSLVPVPQASPCGISLGSHTTLWAYSHSPSLLVWTILELQWKESTAQMELMIVSEEENESNVPGHAILRSVHSLCHTQDNKNDHLRSSDCVKNTVLDAPLYTTLLAF